ncbi:hypothetical protein JCM3766R1_005516 [Sporobolomyces carnicolor]
MSHIASPRPVRPSLRLAKFASFSRNNVGGLLDQCDGISPSSPLFPRRPPDLDLDLDLGSLGGERSPYSPYSPASISFPPCFCSSRPGSPSSSSSSYAGGFPSYICELCNPYPSSPRSPPLSPLSPTFSTWTTSSDTSNAPVSPACEVDDPSILFEFFSIVDRATSSSTSSSPCPSPLAESRTLETTDRAGTPLLSHYATTPSPSHPACLSVTSSPPHSKKRERDGKLKWRSWIKKSSTTDPGQSSTYPRRQ